MTPLFANPTLDFRTMGSYFAKFYIQHNWIGEYLCESCNEWKYYGEHEGVMELVPVLFEVMYERL